MAIAVYFYRFYFDVKICKLGFNMPTSTYKSVLIGIKNKYGGLFMLANKAFSA
jgi:hypothetical protein